MIALHDIWWAVITPPHVASRHIHHALCTPKIGGHWCVGPMPDNPKEYDHHIARVPAAWYHYHVAMVWRYPPERLVGLYEHYVKYRRDAFGEEPQTWKWFVEQVVNDDESHLSWMYRFTIARWLEFYDYPRVDRILRFDRLSQELTTLARFQIKLLPPNCHHGHWIKYYDDEIMAIVAAWCKPDIDMYEKYLGVPYDGLTWENRHAYLSNNNGNDAGA